MYRPEAMARFHYDMPAELERIKARMRYGFLAGLDNSVAIAGELAEIVQYERTVDTINELYASFAALAPADLQGAAVARRNPISGDVKSDQATTALKFHGFVGEWEFDLLLAEHYDDLVAGVQQGLGQVEETLLAAAGHQDLLGREVEAVVALELGDDGLLQARGAVDRCVLGLAVGHGLAGLVVFPSVDEGDAFPDDPDDNALFFREPADDSYVELTAKDGDNMTVF